MRNSSHAAVAPPPLLGQVVWLANIPIRRHSVARLWFLERSEELPPQVPRLEAFEFWCVVDHLPALPGRMGGKMKFGWLIFYLTLPWLGTATNQERELTSRDLLVEYHRLLPINLAFQQGIQLDDEKFPGI